MQSIHSSSPPPKKAKTIPSAEKVMCRATTSAERLEVLRGARRHRPRRRLSRRCAPPPLSTLLGGLAHNELHLHEVCAPIKIVDIARHVNVWSSSNLQVRRHLKTRQPLSRTARFRLGPVRRRPPPPQHPPLPNSDIQFVKAVIEVECAWLSDRQQVVSPHMSGRREENSDVAIIETAGAMEAVLDISSPEGSLRNEEVSKVHLAQSKCRIYELTRLRSSPFCVRGASGLVQRRFLQACSKAAHPPQWPLACGTTPTLRKSPSTLELVSRPSAHVVRVGRSGAGSEPERKKGRRVGERGRGASRANKPHFRQDFPPARDCLRPIDRQLQGRTMAAMGAVGEIILKSKLKSFHAKLNWTVCYDQTCVID
ncbi:hypothetical protein LAZ67_X001368 [Cordylochernes scorpioides]|uniref:Uncharacterized protein n=1 Tax=Cordylochernes scorpioides TaxID=51811 RepID=A0ABY6LSE1_9ARAC|nr:hypothetical protein LAZ67_X001368 [Cordylochernes scorpioides]